MIDEALSETPIRSTSERFVPSDEIRTRFSSAMSAMYRSEVPQYGTLVDLVAQVNAQVLRRDPTVLPGGEVEAARLDVERHGAIRLGTPRELHTIRRIFAVMGMSPVGYYDLSAAGVPVHSTAFRPVTRAALDANPFRIFTSLLRLELITDPALRDTAARILGNRQIFTARALALTNLCETQGGLTGPQADEFVQEVLETFRWHGAATVSHDEYQRLHHAHRLIADVVCFKSPHINHLTPRTLDIDAAQAEMLRRGINAKETIEGPPRRKVPILLRQTSFKALEEAVTFSDGPQAEGTHTARFGEIEQRGIALTRRGRAHYDALLERAQAQDAAADYPTRLAKAFEDFPDDLASLRRDGLGFFRYTVREGADPRAAAGKDLETLVEQGIVGATPITYEDFLPVSAAGIFQSNLGGTTRRSYGASAAQQQFEEALGAQVIDEISLYEVEQAASIERVKQQLPPGASA